LDKVCLLPVLNLANGLSGFASERTNY